MDVLLIDDFALAPLQDQERRDLLEILEDRYGTRSTIITSQLPLPSTTTYIGEPTLADSICDRLLHNSHRSATRTLTTKGGQARHLTAGRPASLRSIMILRSA